MPRNLALILEIEDPEAPSGNKCFSFHMWSLNSDWLLHLINMGFRAEGFIHNWTLAITSAEKGSFRLSWLLAVTPI